MAYANPFLKQEDEMFAPSMANAFAPVVNNTAPQNNVAANTMVDTSFGNNMGLGSNTIEAPKPQEVKQSPTTGILKSVAKIGLSTAGMPPELANLAVEGASGAMGDRNADMGGALAGMATGSVSKELMQSPLGGALGLDKLKELGKNTGFASFFAPSRGIR